MSNLETKYLVSELPKDVRIDDIRIVHIQDTETDTDGSPTKVMDWYIVQRLCLWGEITYWLSVHESDNLDIAFIYAQSEQLFDGIILGVFSERLADHPSFIRYKWRIVDSKDNSIKCFSDNAQAHAFILDHKKANPSGDKYSVIRYRKRKDDNSIGYRASNRQTHPFSIIYHHNDRCS